MNTKTKEVTIKNNNQYAYMLVAYNASIAALKQTTHKMFDNPLKQLKKERRALFQGNYTEYNGTFNGDAMDLLAGLRCSSSANNDIASDLINQAYLAILEYISIADKDQHALDELYMAVFPNLNRYIYQQKKIWKKPKIKELADKIIHEDGTIEYKDPYSYAVNGYEYYDLQDRQVFRSLIKKYLQLPGSEPIDIKIIGRLLAGNFKKVEFCERYGMNSRKLEKRIKVIQQRILEIIPDIDLIVQRITYDGQRKRNRIQLVTVIKQGRYINAINYNRNKLKLK